MSFKKSPTEFSLSAIDLKNSCGSSTSGFMIVPHNIYRIPPFIDKRLPQGGNRLILYQPTVESLTRHREIVNASHITLSDRRSGYPRDFCHLFILHFCMRRQSNGL
jgi:hypothetical protein